jgi:hypothetical protein
LNTNNNPFNSSTSWLGSSLSTIGNLTHLRESITNGTAIAVSDGSYDAISNQASAAYTLLDSTGQHGLECSMDVPGDASCQNAYRAEVAGILGVLFLIQLSSYIFDQSHGNVSVYCDGKSALEQVFDFSRDIGTAKSKQSDLIMATRTVIQNMEVTLDHHHVKGHQDDNILLELLPLPAQVNVHTDQKAKRHLRTTLNRTTHLPLDKSHPDGPISVYYKNVRIFDNLSSNLYDVISIQRLVDYWVHIGRFPADYQNRISWKSVENTSAILSSAKRRFVSKWVSEECGVSTTLTKWNHRYINGCPFCLSPNENTEHVLCCPQESASRIWCEQLSSLDKHLRKLRTHPNLHQLIISRLSTWHDKVDDVNFMVERDIALAIAHQQVIGWKAFLEGLIVKDILQIQHEYYQSIQRRSTGLSWSTKLSKFMWEMIHTLWMERNEQLHKTDRIHELHGKQQLFQSIRLEHEIGRGALPVHTNGYFNVTLERLLRKSIQEHVAWFYAVRRSREMTGGPQLILDEFTNNIPLRKWVGLPT